jgi:hypothetical protein
VLIFCPRCNGSLPDHLLRAPHVDGSCPTCGTNLALTIFPALFRPAAKIDPSGLQTEEGEATCFEHASKRAVAVCHKCGRFLCALCEVEVAGQIWCPGCLIPGDAGGPIHALEKRRTLFDSIALALATLPALAIYPIILTAPTVVYLCIRYWRKPSSLVPRGKWRLITALLIALAELGLIILGVVGIIYQQQTRTGVGHK